MKKILFSVLIMITIGAMVSCTDDLTEIPKSHQANMPNSPALEVKYIDQHEAVEAFNKLQETFSGKERRSNGTTEYPEYYGGCYIDENANLVVYIAGDSIISRARIANTLGENIITKYCKYSFQELTNVMEQIGAFVRANPSSPVSQNIAVVSIMDKENNIVVKLLDCNEQKIAEFKELVINSSAVSFKETVTRVTPYASVATPGIKILSYGGGGSLGYRVTRSGQVGYISSAHGVSLYNYIALDGNQFGYCTMRQYSGPIDASFSEDRFTADYSPIINGTSTRLSTSVQDPIVIYKSADATGVTSGWVTSSNSQYTTTDGVYLSDIAGTNLIADRGDSGGIVYCDVYGGQASVSGIIQGGTWGNTYVVKAPNINRAFGCMPY